MIPGVSELIKLFGLLVGLDIVEDEIDIGNAANYSIAYSPDEVRIPISGEYVEEEPTEEEAEIMFILDYGFEAWEEKMESILLGDQDDA